MGTVARSPRLLLVLLALAVCPYFVDLGGSSIWDANEAFYVETPREMIERGDYVSPTFNYEPRLNKPVLSYWIVAASYHLFGVSVWAQRLPIAIGAVVMIATAFVLAWAATPQRRAHAAGGPDAPDPGALRWRAALWAAIGLAITPRLLMFARRIFIDIYISMFLGLTLLFFALAERYPERRRLFLLLMYVAAGLGVLTKGPIAVALPGLVFLGYLLVHREPARIRSMMIPAGLVIVTVLVAPYYVALYARHGWEPIITFLVGENVARYTDGVGVDARRPVWFYLPVVLSDSFPWSAFLFAAAAGWLGRRRASRATIPAAARETRVGEAFPDRPRRVQTLLWLWILGIVLFFTASAAKQDLYIFPIVPAVAALAGVAIVCGPENGVRWTIGAVGAATIAAGAGVTYLVGSPAGQYMLAGARMMGIAAMLGGAAAVGAAWARRLRPGLLAVGATFVLLDWIFVVRVLPDFERFKPVPGFARTLEPRLRPGDVVLTYDEALPSLVYYLRRHVEPYFEPEPLVAHFQSGQAVYAVLSANNYRDLATAFGTRTCILDRRPTFDVKLRNMLAQEPPPELLLISNRCAAE